MLQRTPKKKPPAWRRNLKNQPTTPSRTKEEVASAAKTAFFKKVNALLSAALCDPAVLAGDRSEEGQAALTLLTIHQLFDLALEYITEFHNVDRVVPTDAGINLVLGFMQLLREGNVDHPMRAHILGLGTRAIRGAKAPASRSERMLQEAVVVLVIAYRLAAKQEHKRTSAVGRVLGECRRLNLEYTKYQIDKWCLRHKAAAAEIKQAKKTKKTHLERKAEALIG